MRAQYISLILFGGILVVKGRSSTPDYESDGFLPSPVSYFNQPGDQIAMEDKSAYVKMVPAPPTILQSRSGVPDTTAPASETNEITQAASSRFGFGPQNFNPTSVGIPGFYGLLNIDIGGIIAGALIGVASYLFIPKILYFLSGAGALFARSESSSEDGITQLLARVDEALSEYQIDSTVCAQRAVCSYVKSASTNVGEGKATSLDKIVETLARNKLVSFMLDGSGIQQAIEIGQKGGSCSRTYIKCPFNKDSLQRAFKNFMTDIRQ